MAPPSKVKARLTPTPEAIKAVADRAEKQRLIVATPSWVEVDPPWDTQKETIRTFLKFVSHCGLEEAQRIFKMLSREPGKAQQKLIRKLEWFEHLDGMKPKQNVRRLVRELLSEKGIGPRDPKYQNQFDALEKKIRLAKKNRSKILAEFTVLLLPPLAQDETAKYQVVKSRKLQKAKSRTSRKRKMS